MGGHQKKGPNGSTLTGAKKRTKKNLCERKTMSASGVHRNLEQWEKEGKCVPEKKKKSQEKSLGSEKENCLERAGSYAGRSLT